MELTDEQVRSLINAIQTAIRQLGTDITTINDKLDQQNIQLSMTYETVIRDMEDRWQYLSDITKTLEKVIEGKNDEKLEDKDNRIN